MARRKLDQYFTPLFFTEVLHNHPIITDDQKLFEPCSGQGDIVQVLDLEGKRLVVTNDIDGELPSDFHADARKPECFDFIRNDPDPKSWVIVTNPPFRSAFPILQNAVASGASKVALLVRLTFLEPTDERQAWLKQNPPSQIIIMPRWSFLNNGKTDSATYAWIVWEREGTGTAKVSFYSRSDFPEQYAKKRKRKSKAKNEGEKKPSSAKNEFIPS